MAKRKMKEMTIAEMKEIEVREKQAAARSVSSPEAEDFAWADQVKPLPQYPTDEQIQERYQLARVRKLTRVFPELVGSFERYAKLMRK